MINGITPQQEKKRFLTYLCVRMRENILNVNIWKYCSKWTFFKTMTQLWQAKELNLFHVCFSNDTEFSSCWHSPKFSKLLMMHRNQRFISCCFSEYENCLLPSTYYRIFCTISYRSPSCLTRERLHSTLPEKTCPENNLVRSWQKWAAD